MQMYDKYLSRGRSECESRFSDLWDFLFLSGDLCFDLQADKRFKDALKIIEAWGRPQLV